jgi:hypothetical protein
MGLWAELKGAWRVWRNRRAYLGKPEAQEMALVYTDAAGNMWYGLVDPLQLPADRAISALVGMRRNDLNYTEADEREWLKETREAHNANDHAKVGYHLTIKEDRLDWACEEKTLLEIAKVYYWINEEPQDGPLLPVWQAKKEAAWEADPDAKAFFLREAYWLTNGFSDLSPSDIQTYLAVRRKKIQMETKPKPAARRGGKRAASATPAK